MELGVGMGVVEGVGGVDIFVSVSSSSSSSSTPTTIPTLQLANCATHSKRESVGALDSGFKVEAGAMNTWYDPQESALSLFYILYLVAR